MSDTSNFIMYGFFTLYGTEPRFETCQDKGYLEKKADNILDEGGFCSPVYKLNTPTELEEIANRYIQNKFGLGGRV